MKRCAKCDFQNSDSARYCSSCGQPLTQQNPAVEKPSSSVRTISHAMVSTSFDLIGYQVDQNLGLVRGIVVRSRSIVGTVGASLQTLVGGDITLFTELCEKTRNDAFERMLQHAFDLGANGVIGVRYDATEIMNGVTEVLCYGTAVIAKAK